MFGKMRNLAAHLHERLIEKRVTLAVAESCTGGLVSKMLTDMPGSSAYMIMGIIAYHDSVKSGILKVPAALIARRGAVSGEVTGKMAAQVRKISGADIGIAISGIAGPGGGTAAKPVGTVFIAVESGWGATLRKFRFRGSRSAIRQQATLKSLMLLGTVVPK